PVTVHLKDVSVAEMLVLFENLSSEPVLVQAIALHAARCALVSVDTAPDVARSQALDAIAAAVRAKGFEVTHPTGYWLVRAPSSEREIACPNDLTKAAAESAPPPAPSSSSSSAAPSTPDEAALAEILKSIREVSETEHVITERGLDLIVEHLPF